MKRMLTGLQPTGVITLGNYIGAIKQMVKMQDEYESFIFVADLHAITVIKDDLNLKDNTRSLISLYLACGIDPNKNTIFVQSQNEYHTNVSWLLECNSYFGELSRMHQFKEKSQGKDNFTAGLFTYPVLMASDILIYDTDLVPVGYDQKQHVELARDIAIRFNNRYGDIFKVPEPMISEGGTKIRDLIDPTKKMSKSSPNQNGVIRLLDTKEEIVKKIMKATTDSDNIVKYDMENKPGISNLLNIYTSLTNKSIEEAENIFKDSNYGTFKKAVCEVVVNELLPIQEKYKEIYNSDIIDNILRDGANKTRSIAKKKYEDMKNILGFYNC